MPGTPTAPDAKNLVGRPLPILEPLGLKPAGELAAGKKILVCFWDMEQRPSRQFILQLAAQAANLQKQGVVVVCVHAATGDAQKVREWLATSKVTAPCGQVPAKDMENFLTVWGAVRLPWLVLTDEKHIVQAEGFDLQDLNDRIKEPSRQPVQAEKVK